MRREPLEEILGRFRVTALGFFGIRRLDAELANYSSKPINNPVYAGFTSYDEVAYNLERLRAKVDMRKEYQRALIHESMRQHEFMVQVVSSTESVFSIALPANELVG